MTTPNPNDNPGIFVRIPLTEQDRQLFTSLSNPTLSALLSSGCASGLQQNEAQETPPELQPEDVDSADKSKKKADETSTTPSRKEKSLGILCQKFLETMGRNLRDNMEVHLEVVARQMDTEKRRIYDIVNVMEALEAMSKTNKSFYRWNTLLDLPRLMQTLKEEAKEGQMPKRIKEVEDAMCSFTELGARYREPVPSTDANESRSPGSPSASAQSMGSEQQPTSSSNTTPKDRAAKNSLAQLCRRFLMVLMCNPTEKRKVSLDVASTVLIKETEKEGFEPPSRSRCRRLYDIANVLVAMCLIKKVHYLFGTKKIPLFEYCGPEPTDSEEEGQINMLEFVRRSQLAHPDEPTWTAIFGPRKMDCRLLRLTESYFPDIVARQNLPPKDLQFSKSDLTKPPRLQKNKRQVLDEIDPFKNENQSSDSNESFGHTSTEFPRPFKKRFFSTSSKANVNLSDNKENWPWVTTATNENDGNKVVMPPLKPVSFLNQQLSSNPGGESSSSAQTFPDLMSTNNFLPLNFSSALPSTPNTYQQQQANFLLGLQLHHYHQNMVAAQQSQLPSSTFNLSNSAFKPVNLEQSSSKKPFGSSQTNR